MTTIVPILITESSSESSSQEHDDDVSTSDEDDSSAWSSSELLGAARRSTENDMDKTSTRCDDSLAFVPVLIPITGILTMLLTVAWSCQTHFDCARHYPTLSYAATFYPEGRVFTIGMCLVSLLIGATTALVRWYLHLSLAANHLRHRLLFFDPVAACPSVSLMVLAIYDMKHHHDVHIVSTVIFFISGWVVIGLFHFGRLLVLRGQGTCAPSRGLWWGRVFITIGLGATAAFAFCFLSVNHVIPNPFGCTAFQEALAELIAIVCQLLYMGTLAEEVSKLNHLVEREYALLLTRAD